MGIVAKTLNSANSYVNPLLRDFTKTAEDNFKKIAKDLDNDCKINGGFFDDIGDLLCQFLDKKGWLRLKDNPNKYQKQIIDCYDYGERVIEGIFRAARDYDSSFGSRISLYESQAEIGISILKELAECLDPSIQKHEPKVEDRLMWFGSNWITYNGELVKIDDLRIKLGQFHRQNQAHKYSQSEIEMFCNQIGSENIFLDYSDFIYTHELNYGALEAAGMVVFLGTKITKEQIESILTGEGYAEKAARENLSTIIDSVISSDSNYADFISDHEYAKDVIIEFIKSKEKKDKATFEEKYPNYEYTRYDRFIQLMGGIDVVKKMVDIYPEMIDYLFNDYSKGLDILNSMESLCGGNITPEMQKAIDRLQRDYSKKWAGILNRLWDETVDFGLDQGTGALVKWVKEKFPAYGVLKSLMEISGGQEKAEGYAKLLSLQNIAYDTRIAFRKAVEKVQSGVYTEDSANAGVGQYTDDDLETVENLFQVLKQTHLAIYKAYRDMCVDDPMKQIYANQQIENISKITLNNFDKYPRDNYCF